MGGTGNDTIYGDQNGAEVTSSDPNIADGGDDIDGGGGLDTISAGGGDDVVKANMPTATTQTVNGGSGRDFLIVTGTPGNDNYTVDKFASHVVRIKQTSGTGQIQGTSIEELDVDLGAGSDRILVNLLSGSDTTLVGVNAGQIVTDTGQTEQVDDPDNPGLHITRKIVTVAPDNAGDVITLLGGSGVDTFTISSANPVCGRTRYLAICRFCSCA